MRGLLTRGLLYTSRMYNRRLGCIDAESFSLRGWAPAVLEICDEKKKYSIFHAKPTPQPSVNFTLLFVKEFFSHCVDWINIDFLNYFYAKLIAAFLFTTVSYWILWQSQNIKWNIFKRLLSIKFVGPTFFGTFFFVSNMEKIVPNQKNRVFEKSKKNVFAVLKVLWKNESM